MVAEPIIRDVVTNFKEISTQQNDEELAAALEVIEERLGYAAKDAKRAVAAEDPRVQGYERMAAENRQRYEADLNFFSDGVNRAYWDGLQKVVIEAIGRPAAMSDKAIEMLSTEVMNEVSAALAARTDLKRIFEGQKRVGNFSPEYQAQVADFVLKYARQIVPAKARARLTAWTNDILRVNADELKKKADSPVKKDIGAGSGASASKSSSKKINYRTMSDDDILNS
jgi:hypothetical protein